MFPALGGPIYFLADGLQGGFALSHGGEVAFVGDQEQGEVQSLSAVGSQTLLVGVEEEAILLVDGRGDCLHQGTTTV